MVGLRNDPWAGARGALNVLFWVLLAALIFNVATGLLSRGLMQSLRGGDVEDFDRVLKLLSTVHFVRSLADVALTVFLVVTFAKLMTVPAPAVKSAATAALIAAAFLTAFNVLDVVRMADELADRRGKPLISEKVGDYLWYASVLAGIACTTLTVVVAAALARARQAPFLIGVGIGAIVAYVLFALVPIVVFKLLDKPPRFTRESPWAWTMIQLGLYAAWGAMMLVVIAKMRDAVRPARMPGR